MCYAKHCFTKLGDIGWPWLGERLALSWSPFVPHRILFALVLHLKCNLLLFAGDGARIN